MFARVSPTLISPTRTYADYRAMIYVKNLIQFFNLRRVWWDTRAVALASKVTRTIKRHCTYYQLPKPFVVVRRNTTNGRSNCRGKNAATKGGFVAPKPLPVPSRPRIIVLR